jgi:hypothetical protein
MSGRSSAVLPHYLLCIYTSQAPERSEFLIPIHVWCSVLKSTHLEIRSNGGQHQSHNLAIEHFSRSEIICLDDLALRYSSFDDDVTFVSSASDRRWYSGSRRRRCGAEWPGCQRPGISRDTRENQSAWCPRKPPRDLERKDGAEAVSKDGIRQISH